MLTYKTETVYFTPTVLQQSCINLIKATYIERQERKGTGLRDLIVQPLYTNEYDTLTITTPRRSGLSTMCSFLCQDPFFADKRILVESKVLNFLTKEERSLLFPKNVTAITHISGQTHFEYPYDLVLIDNHFHKEEPKLASKFVTGVPLIVLLNTGNH